MGRSIETLYEIVRSQNMSARPEYTSGRGATLSDLDSKRLLGIQSGIKKEFGEKASRAFVKMVENIKVLSCSTFLQELYSLYYSDWEIKKHKKEAPGYAVAKNEDGEYNMTSGFATIFGIMSCSDRDQTVQIRDQFLRSNGIVTKFMSYQLKQN